MLLKLETIRLGLYTTEPTGEKVRIAGRSVFG
jgi:hypothetical protein